MNDTEGHVDILVCMAGTGGTGFGTASYLRSRNPNLQVVLVQPHPDSRLTPEHPDAQTGESGKEHRGHRPGQRHEISVYADVPAEMIKTR